MTEQDNTEVSETESKVHKHPFIFYATGAECKNKALRASAAGHPTNQDVRTHRRVNSAGHVHFVYTYKDPWFVRMAAWRQGA
jgi:hypothetical protein